MTRLSKCWNHQYFLYCRRKTRRNKPYGNKGQASQVQQETSHGASSYGFRNGFTSAHQKAEIKAQTKPERMTLLHEEWYLITMQGTSHSLHEELLYQCHRNPGQHLPRAQHRRVPSPSPLPLWARGTPALLLGVTGSRNTPRQWRGRARRCSSCTEGAGSGSSRRGGSCCHWAPPPAAWCGDPGK